ncbi:hypothetical protein B0T20DRAFT_26477 [Sordaria brevicollis]|uniref:ER-bound oxygenase mpaB/mpaB'/Rubber oxygenase catalytic domain-containing protein n=1 Tax=Sordaria brevicollis TaxID=83679 RepID=A0AAE0PP31_SORBR|nr:hypothetical protein B0T20DRAFT_26477 [Sordaria brevicollis]
MIPCYDERDGHTYEKIVLKVEPHTSIEAAILLDRTQHISFRSFRLNITAAMASPQTSTKLVLACPHETHQPQPPNLTVKKAPILACPVPPTPPSSALLLTSIISTLLLWSSGPYSILLQIANPSIALGSCTHSRFATSTKFDLTFSRLRRTSAYILAVALGTPEQKKGGG